MGSITTLLGAISWPVVALIALIAAGVGFLNKPLTAISAGIAKFFSEFRTFKKDLETTEVTLKGLVDSISKTQEAISLVDFSTLKNEIQDVTTTLSDLAQRDMLSTKELLEASAERAAPPQVENVGQDLADGNDEIETETLTPFKMLSNIEYEWKIVTDGLRRRAGALHYDGRAIAETAYALVDKRRKLPLQSDQARLLATMHSQFKSYTRRRFTVDEWMTKPTYDSFMDAAKIAKAFLQ